MGGDGAAALVGLFSNRALLIFSVSVSDSGLLLHPGLPNVNAVTCDFRLETRVKEKLLNIQLVQTIYVS